MKDKLTWILKRRLSPLLLLLLFSIITFCLFLPYPTSQTAAGHGLPLYQPPQIYDSPPSLSSSDSYRIHYPTQSIDSDTSAMPKIEQLGDQPTVLILTPLKEAQSVLSSYFAQVESLSYPKHLISLAFLVSDSQDKTQQHLDTYLRTLLPRGYRRVTVIHKDFEYSLNREERHAYADQPIRRSVLAKSRNYLVQAALEDERWVLWLDSDLQSIHRTLVEDLLGFNKSVLVPNCLWKSLFGCLHPYDRNAWKDTPASREWIERLQDDELVFEGYDVNTRRIMLADMRSSDQHNPHSRLVELDGVGGTVLLVWADLHRQGLVFPVAPYKHTIETEGLAQLAQDMGVRVYGLPDYFVFH